MFNKLLIIITLMMFSVCALAQDAEETAPVSPVRAALEQARQNVRDGDNGAAIEVLKALQQGGFNAAPVITGDEVLKTLAGVPEFDALIRTMLVQAFPCEHDAAFRAFDFWEGEWDVHVANGQLVGHNTITAEQHGCLLVEHWTSATGGSGTSINFLDKATNEWVQVWNAASGTQIHIRGGMTDDGMLLTGKIHYVSNDTTADFRGLWTPLPDGRVRQFFEQSNDGGDSWSPWFEGFYSRRDNAE